MKPPAAAPAIGDQIRWVKPVGAARTPSRGRGVILGGPVPLLGGVIWVYTVRPERGLGGVKQDATCIQLDWIDEVHRQSVNLFEECPNCEESYYFFAGDYMCAECRSEEWYLQDLT